MLLDPIHFVNTPIDRFTARSHELQLGYIYTSITAARKQLDKTEEMIADLAQKLSTERLALEEACDSFELRIHAKHKTLPEYWRMWARKKSEERKITNKGEINELSN